MDAKLGHVRRHACSAVVLLFAVSGVRLALANSAAIFCEQSGGRIEIETAANGSQKGVCILPSGTRVDEWVYFRNAHRTTH